MINHVFQKEKWKVLGNWVRLGNLYGTESLGDEDDQDSLASGGDWGHEGCRAWWDYPDGLSRITGLILATSSSLDPWMIYGCEAAILEVGEGNLARHQLCRVGGKGSNGYRKKSWVGTQEARLSILPTSGCVTLGTIFLTYKMERRRGPAQLCNLDLSFLLLFPWPPFSSAFPPTT